MDEKDLRKKKLEDLRVVARAMDIKSITTFKKEELIQEIIRAGKKPSGLEKASVEKIAKIDNKENVVHEKKKKNPLI